MADLVWQMFGSYPVVAYSPSLLGSTVEDEVKKLKRLIYCRGQYADLASIDLYARHNSDDDTVFFTLSKSTPEGAPFIGEVIVGGNLYCPYLEYVAMGKVIEAVGCCAVSILDNGRILRDQIFVLTRNHHLVGITPT